MLKEAEGPGNAAIDLSTNGDGSIVTNQDGVPIFRLPMPGTWTPPAILTSQLQNIPWENGGKAYNYWWANQGQAPAANYQQGFNFGSYFPGLPAAPGVSNPQISPRGTNLGFGIQFAPKLGGDDSVGPGVPPATKGNYRESTGVINSPIDLIRKGYGVAPGDTGGTADWGGGPTGNPGGTGTSTTVAPSLASWLSNAMSGYSVTPGTYDFGPNSEIWQNGFGSIFGMGNTFTANPTQMQALVAQGIPVRLGETGRVIWRNPQTGVTQMYNADNLDSRIMALGRGSASDQAIFAALMNAYKPITGWSSGASGYMGSTNLGLGG